MDEDRALRRVDEELDAMFAGVAAPPHFAPALLRRVREPRVTRLPEILDSIGWAAVLAIIFVVLLRLAPGVDSLYWIWGVASAIVPPAFWFGFRSLKTW
jgi:hypothetical protein